MLFYKKLPMQPKTTPWDKFIFAVFILFSCHGNHVWATDAPWGCPHNNSSISRRFEVKMLKLSGNDLDMLLHSMNYRNSIQSNRLKIITKTIRTFKTRENKRSYFGHWKTRIALKCMIVVHWMQKHTEISHSKNGRSWIKPWKVIFVSILVFSWNLKFQEIVI